MTMTKTNLQKHDGMFTGVLHEEFLEVVAGGREDDLVALQASSIAGKGHVTECLRRDSCTEAE